MKQMNLWQRPIVFASLASIAVTGGLKTNSPAIASTVTPPAIQQSFLSQGQYQLAQTMNMTASTSCRLVVIKGPGVLNVRKRPSATSAVVATLKNGTQVTIVNRGSNGWVPISAPAQGYVYVTHLKMC
jgi:hypothetical protein